MRFGLMVSRSRSGCKRPFGYLSPTSGSAFGRGSDAVVFLSSDAHPTTWHSGVKYLLRHKHKNIAPACLHRYIGRPELAGALEQQVRRGGFFEWHSWAEKDHLSAGTWTVSVTYPDGQPLPCGPDAQPCRFTINVG